MPTLRFVHRFHWREVAGWSEEVFYTGTLNLADAGTEGYAKGRALLRAGFMSKDCVVIDCLVNDVTNPSVVRTINCNTVGITGPGGPNADHQSETPLASVRAKVSSNDGPPRVYHFRGLADSDCNNGRVTWNQSGPEAFNEYMRILTDGGECVQKAVFDPEVPVIGTNDKNSRKIEVSALPADIAVGDLVRVKTQVVGNGPRVRYVGRVKSFAAASSGAYAYVEVSSWTHGQCKDGLLCLFEYEYKEHNAWSTYSPNYIVYKKTGRPFSPFRGRA